jgi:dTDP-4-dehydrorhamnose reductase
MNERAQTAFQQFQGRTFLITGAGGMLGTALREVLAETAPGADVFSLPREALDVTDRAAVLAQRNRQVDYILHCGGDVNADRCERDPIQCETVHVGGTRNIIELAQLTGATVYYPQSVFIFDGREAPITESTGPCPTLAYGRSKWIAEQLLREALPESLVVRMAGFFGGAERDKNFVGTFSRHLIDLVALGETKCGVGDRLWQPTYTRDLAQNGLLLLALGKTGVYNMACHGEASFFEVAQVILDKLNLSGRITLHRRPMAEFAAKELAHRPPRVLMENRRLAREGLDGQRPWNIALREYLSIAYFQTLEHRSQTDGGNHAL